MLDRALLSEKLDQMFEAALASLDFGPIKKTMQALEWTYESDKEPPDEDRMLQTIRELYRGAKEGSLQSLDVGRHNIGHCFSSGGFSVSVLDYQEHGTGIGVEIEFVAEDSRSDFWMPAHEQHQGEEP